MLDDLFQESPYFKSQATIYQIVKFKGMPTVDAKRISKLLQFVHALGLMNDIGEGRLATLANREMAGVSWQDGSLAAIAFAGLKDLRTQEVCPHGLGL